MSESLNPLDGELRERPVRRLRAPALAFLTCALVTTAVVLAALYHVPAEFHTAMAVGSIVAAIALCVAATTTVYFRDAATRARLTIAEYEAVVTQARESTAEWADRIMAANEAAAEHARDAKHNETRRSAAMAAFAGAASRMQAMTTSMLAELREMENRHADPHVLEDLLQVDHRAAQAGRLADSIAVLSGARSGRRWAKPIAMESILRGAMGRVKDYQRVRLRAIATIAVSGHAAEGVMHTLAELIDNACNFSPPTTEVHVYAAEVPAGVVITIEDSGLVMSESALRRAEQAVSGANRNGRGDSDLSSLSGTRLGLAVVGHLAHKHSLTVSYRPSAIGGTAVVVVVPRDLTARVDRSQGASATITLPAPAPAAIPVPATAPAEDPAALEEPILPKRRRGSTLAAVHPAGLSAPPRPDTTGHIPAPKPAAFGAFQRAFAAKDSDVPAAETLSPSPAVENDR